jgi:sugar/nucleoside kinase (ribokinase family)
VVGRNLLERIITVDDYEHLSSGRLPNDLCDFIAGGAGSEWTLREALRASSGRLAAAVGALATRAVGARGSLPTRGELERFVGGAR